MYSEMTMTLGGDHLRFEQLMRDSYRKVFNMAFRLSGNRTDAEDLTQEAYFRAFRSFKDYEGDRPFENWILRIVSRLFLDHLRARKRRVQTISYDAPLEREGGEVTLFNEIADLSPTAQDQLLSRCIGEEIEESLASLSEEQRLLVQLADVQQLSYSEISALVEAPVGTIRSRLHRVHKVLRRTLRPS